MSIKLMMPSNHFILYVIPFSSCPQPFPSSGSFPLSWLFASGGQTIGASASASVLSMNIQGWCALGPTGLIFLQSKGLSRVFSSTTVQKHRCLAFLMVQLSHLYITTGEALALIRQTFVSKVMSLLFNMLSRFGCSPWGRWESDTTAHLHFHFSLSCTGGGNGNPLQCLAWRIPGTAGPGGLLSVGSHGVGHDWRDSAAAAAVLS